VERKENIPTPKVRAYLQILSALFVSVPLALQAAEPPSKCDQICYAYRQSTILERQEAIRAGCPNYISAISNPVVARVRLAPELVGGLNSAVDDELWFVIHGKELWRKKYTSLDGAESSWRKDQIANGCNKLQLFYANTQPPDAHFMAELGELAFCGTDGMCGRKYKEGITFGTGLIYKSPAVEASLWKSRIENPNANGQCHCTDPNTNELFKALSKQFATAPKK
jgi:hypothetical protein